MLQSAFDLYDWMRFDFTFAPEGKDLRLQRAEINEPEKLIYSRLREKIKYLENSIYEVENNKEMSMRLLELGKLYRQAEMYDNAIARLEESIEIEQALRGNL